MIFGIVLIALIIILHNWSSGGIKPPGYWVNWPANKKEKRP
jgi:hypothetical protein